MICPRCGSFIDAGEPYCRECGYDGEDDLVEIDYDKYDTDELEEALRKYGYSIEELDAGLIDEDVLMEILRDLDSY